MTTFCDSGPTAEAVPANYENPFRMDPDTECVWIEGYEEYQTFDPAITGVSLGGAGSGTSARWKRMNNRSVHFYCTFTLGSGFSISGALNVTLPLPAADASALNVAPISGAFHDVGTAFYPGLFDYPSVQVARMFVRRTDSGSYEIARTPSATVPFTWVVGDKLTMGGFYEPSTGA